MRVFQLHASDQGFLHADQFGNDNRDGNSDKIFKVGLLDIPQTNFCAEAALELYIIELPAVEVGLRTVNLCAEGCMVCKMPAMSDRSTK